MSYQLDQFYIQVSKYNTAKGELETQLDGKARQTLTMLKAYFLSCKNDQNHEHAKEAENYYEEIVKLGG